MGFLPKHPIFKVPMPIVYSLMVVTSIALLPPAIIAKVRSAPSEKRRIHLIQNMDNQPRYEAQQISPFFEDNRAMRPLISGVVSNSANTENDHLALGYENGTWSKTIPDVLTIDTTFLNRGKERYNIYCSVCHGYAGYGDGMIHKRAQQLLEAGVDGTVWVAPSNLHEVRIRQQPVGKIYNTITNGIRNMAGYKAQISTEDRWAITAYVRSIQLSQDFNINNLSNPNDLFSPLNEEELGE